MSRIISKKYLFAIILVAFIIVAGASFIHFYGMIYSAGMDGSHTPCTAYLQLSQLTSCNKFIDPLLTLLIVATLLICKFLRREIIISKFIKQVYHVFLCKIKPKLLINILFKKGILHPRLYA